jgi:hypothetical protein
MKPLNPTIHCMDGFTISVQAREFSYCTPRTDEGPHTHMEGGFPSSPPLDPELLEARENSYADHGDPCNTVYPYVSREVFERELALHGGIKSGKLPE